MRLGYCPLQARHLAGGRQTAHDEFPPYLRLFVDIIIVPEAANILQTLDRGAGGVDPQARA